MVAMAKNTSISLGRHFDRFIKKQVSAGRFGTASEVVRAGLRLLEEDEARLASIRAALERGEKSGFVESFSMDDVIRTATGRRRSKAS